MTDLPYADPQAFRQALRDRLRGLAAATPGLELHDLQRQLAYDRLLARIFATEPDRWVLKGATAMLARLEGVGRHTLDVDLYRSGGDLDDAERALVDCAARDLGDWFRFTLSPGRLIEPQGARALRIPVVAFLGVTRYADFHVDLVTDIVMTGEPEVVAPLVPIELPGLIRAHYRAYPIVDHIADKLCAFVEIHLRASGTTETSSRYRDLADIVTFAHTSRPEAAALTRAVHSEARRRGRPLPVALAAPSADWRSGYARVARDVPGLAERDLVAALATASTFLDPILNGTAQGRWEPDLLSWH